MKKIILFIFCLITILINAQPSFQWAKQFDGTSSSSLGTSVEIDASGNIYSTGSFMGIIDFDPGPGAYTLTSVPSVISNIYISKLDANGNFIWAKSINANYINNVFLTSDPTGNVYISGGFQGVSTDFDPGPGTYTLNSTNAGVFVLKLDASGNFVWARQMGNSLNYAIGIDVDAVGNIYTTGYFDQIADFDPGPGTFTLATPATSNFETFISKLDASGNFVWAKSFDVGPNNEDSKGMDIKVDATGNSYTTGWFYGTSDFDPGPGTYTLNTSSTDIFIAKLDANGNFVWAKQMGNTSTSKSRSIAIDASGNSYITGYFNGVVGVGGLTSAGSNDILISKLDPLGNFVWAKNVGGTLNDYAYSIGVDGSGNVYTIGTFSGTADFDPGTGTFNLTSGGAEDVFILKLNSNGNLAGVKQLGGTSSDVGFSISLDAPGNLCATGFFQGTSDFDPGAGTYTLVCSGANDAFVYKMSQLAMTVKENTNLVDANIYPNPTKDILNIELDNYKGESLQMEISDISGRIILKEKTEANHLQVNIKNVSTGLYFLNVLSDNKVIATQKIIKE